MHQRPLYMEELLSAPLASSPVVNIAESDLCCCIYTSGSTGQPKGVLIEHGNLSNFVYPSPKNRGANGITQRGTSLLALAQFTFDVSVMEMYLALTAGLKLVLALDRDILNPDRLRELMLDERVDAICCTPAYLSTLIAIPSMREALAGIKTYDFGAEAFPGRLYDQIIALNPDAYVMNGYGPTEVTISCTMKVIESSEGVTIGTPNAQRQRLRICR